MNTKAVHYAFIVLWLGAYGGLLNAGQYQQVAGLHVEDQDKHVAELDVEKLADAYQMNIKRLRSDARSQEERLAGELGLYDIISTIDKGLEALPLCPEIESETKSIQTTALERLKKYFKNSSSDRWSIFQSGRNLIQTDFTDGWDMLLPMLKNPELSCASCPLILWTDLIMKAEKRRAVLASERDKRFLDITDKINYLLARTIESELHCNPNPHVSVYCYSEATREVDPKSDLATFAYQGIKRLSKGNPHAQLLYLLRVLQNTMQGNPVQLMERVTQAMSEKDTYTPGDDFLLEWFKRIDEIHESRQGTHPLQASKKGIGKKKGKLSKKKKVKVGRQSVESSDISDQIFTQFDTLALGYLYENTRLNNYLEKMKRNIDSLVIEKIKNPYVSGLGYLGARLATSRHSQSSEIFFNFACLLKNPIALLFKDFGVINAFFEGNAQQKDVASRLIKMEDALLGLQSIEGILYTPASLIALYRIFDFKLKDTYVQGNHKKAERLSEKLRDSGFAIGSYFHGLCLQKSGRDTEAQQSFDRFFAYGIPDHLEQPLRHDLYLVHAYEHAIGENPNLQKAKELRSRWCAYRMAVSSSGFVGLSDILSNPLFIKINEKLVASQLCNESVSDLLEQLKTVRITK